MNETEELARLSGGHIHIPTKLCTVGDLERGLFEIFPAQQGEEWDNPGLLCGDATAALRRIAIALDPTFAAITAAKENDCNVLLTHHPAYLEAPNTICSAASGKDVPGALVYEAIQAGVSLIAMHTNLDCSPRANGVINRMLGLQPLGVLAAVAGSQEIGFGHIGSLIGERMTVDQLASRVLSVFGRPPRVWGDTKREVDLVATVGGSGGSFIGDALAAHATVLVTGEVGYHKALEAAQQGLCIIEMGHDVSELAMCGVLAQALRELGIEQDRIALLDQSDNWHIPEARRV